jgi:Na+-driven multidrug efflux pump
MVAQNVGARRWDRVARITVGGVIYNVLLTGSLVLLVSLVDRPAFAFFLGDHPDAIETARHIHLLVSWSFVLFGIGFVLSSVVRATGAVVPPLVILFIAAWVVRIPFAKLLEPWLGADAIWWSFSVGSAASVVLTAAYYRFGRWRGAHMLVGSSRR